MIFIWDENKNRSNFEKHRISFEEAKELFRNENSIHFEAKYIEGEQRKAVIGTIQKMEKVFICIYLVTKSGLIRIISVRNASKNERELWQKK